MGSFDEDNLTLWPFSAAKHLEQNVKEYRLWREETETDPTWIEIVVFYAFETVRAETRAVEVRTGAGKVTDEIMDRIIRFPAHYNASCEDLRLKPSNI